MTWLIDDLLDLALSIGEYISQGIYTLIMCLLYPLEIMFFWIGNTLKLILNVFIDFFASLWATFDILYLSISNMTNSLLPHTWSLIILIGLTIVFTLRLYYFIKDISILGNKI